MHQAKHLLQGPNVALYRTLPFALLYILGITATLFDPSRLFDDFFQGLRQSLPDIVGGLVLAPIFALCWLVPALAGAAAFNFWGKSLLRVRLSVSSLFLAFMFFVGVVEGFTASQWIWLDAFMAAQLIVLGMIMKRLIILNWVVFLSVVAGIVFEFSRPLWMILNSGVGCYFLFVTLAPWVWSAERKYD